MCICYCSATGEGLHSYTNSSLGDQTDDRHSTSGYVFLLTDSAISWSLWKQKTVAQSSTEAEYMAMADAVNQAVWYYSFLEELGYTVDDPIPLHGDNKGAIDLTLNPVMGSVKSLAAPECLAWARSRFLWIRVVQWYNRQSSDEGTEPKLDRRWEGNMIAQEVDEYKTESKVQLLRNTYTWYWTAYSK